MMYSENCTTCNILFIMCYWIVGCSASGVRHAIATEKWLEAEHMKKSGGKGEAKAHG